MRGRRPQATFGVSDGTSRNTQHPGGYCLPSRPRKEVIQPQVPLRLPCYDFAPVTGHTMGGYLPCGLVCRLPVQQTSMA